MLLPSQLLYGLKAIQLFQSEISKSNAFQDSPLRRILQIPPTFIDRSFSNQKMHDLISDEYGCKFEQFGETWKTSKMKLLGHLLRTSRGQVWKSDTATSRNIAPATKNDADD